MSRIFVTISSILSLYICVGVEATQLKNSRAGTLSRAFFVSFPLPKSPQTLAPRSPSIRLFWFESDQIRLVFLNLMDESCGEATIAGSANPNPPSEVNRKRRSIQTKLPWVNQARGGGDVSDGENKRKTRRKRESLPQGSKKVFICFHNLYVVMFLEGFDFSGRFLR